MNPNDLSINDLLEEIECLEENIDDMREHITTLENIVERKMKEEGSPVEDCDECDCYECDDDCSQCEIGIEMAREERQDEITLAVQIAVDAVLAKLVERGVL
jgi:hypothetical protein